MQARQKSQKHAPGAHGLANSYTGNVRTMHQRHNKNFDIVTRPPRVSNRDGGRTKNRATLRNA